MKKSHDPVCHTCTDMYFKNYLDSIDVHIWFGIQNLPYKYNVPEYNAGVQHRSNNARFYTDMVPYNCMLYRSATVSGTNCCNKIQLWDLVPDNWTDRITNLHLVSWNMQRISMRKWFMYATPLRSILIRTLDQFKIDQRDLVDFDTKTKKAILKAHSEFLYNARRFLRTIDMEQLLANRITDIRVREHHPFVAIFCEPHSQHAERYIIDPENRTYLTLKQKSHK